MKSNKQINSKSNKNKETDQLNDYEYVGDLKNEDIDSLLEILEKNNKKSIKSSVISNIKKILKKVKNNFRRYEDKICGIVKKGSVDVLLIYNPASGNMFAPTSAKELIKFFKKEKITYKKVKTKPNSKIIPKSVCPHLIIIIGGDGTINQTVNEMMKSELIHIPIAVLSAGVGNDFAETNGTSKFKLKRFIKSHKEELRAGEIPYYNYDLGRIESDTGKVFYFLNSLGINSIDADVIKNIYEIWKRKAHSEEEYVLPIFRSFFLTYKPKEYRLEYFRRSKSKKLKKVKFKGKAGGILIYNNYRRAKGNLNLSGADPRDGVLDVLYYRRFNIFNAIRYAITFVRHFILKKIAYDINFYDYFNTSNKSFIIRDKFAIARIKPVYIMEYDGELADERFNEVVISVIPQALRIIDIHQGNDQK